MNNRQLKESDPFSTYKPKRKFKKAFVIITIGCLILIALLLVKPTIIFLTNKSIIKETTLATEQELNYDYSSYYSSLGYPSDTINLNQLYPTPSDFSQELEVYYITVGDDINPGLYTIDMNQIGSEDFYAKLIITKDDGTPKFQIYRAKGTSKKKFVNLDLEQGDLIEINHNSSIPLGISLIPQSDYVKYDADNPYPGIYSNEKTIDSQKYNLATTQYGALCTKGFKSFDDCQRLSDGDSFEIHEDQILYIDQTWVPSNE